MKVGDEHEKGNIREKSKGGMIAQPPLPPGIQKTLEPVAGAKNGKVSDKQVKASAIASEYTAWLQRID